MRELNYIFAWLFIHANKNAEQQFGIEMRTNECEQNKTAEGVL
jgi:hypothetical protein